MANPSFEQALDIKKSTLEAILRKNPPLATYAYSTYQFFNTYFKGNVQQTGGDKLTGHVTLSSEGNVTTGGFYTPDSLVKKNINQDYELKWRRSSAGMLYSLIEQDINKGPLEIYNATEQQEKSMIKDLVEEVMLKCILGPTSSTDTDNPYGISTWLSLGTTGQTGGFNGYYSCYNDGSTPGEAFAKAGVTCTSTVQPDWANYFADHDGNIDDSLLTILDLANLELNFQPPVIPRNLEMERVTFATYTNKNVISKLNSFYAKADDNMGYRPNSHYGTPTFNGIPMVYCPPLNTANTSVYGTDPIFGVNHNVLYPVILKNWNFRVVTRPVADNHTMESLFIDLVYQNWCNSSPKYAGYLVTNSTVTPS